MDDEQLRLAILGAGPIGLEAALYGRYLGYPAVILERGSKAALRILSRGDDAIGKFSQLASTLGVAALKAQNSDWQPPRASEQLRAAEWRERYLLPLSASDLIGNILNLDTEVTAVDRRDEEDDVSFQIRCRDTRGGESTYEADIVIDATGESAPSWFGDSAAEVELGFGNPEADFYVIGVKGGATTFVAGLTQIRDLFAIIGEREDLDVYATLPALE